MKFTLIAAGVLLIVLPAGGPAQVLDSTGAARDSARSPIPPAGDTSLHVPIPGIGSIAEKGLQTAILPDSAMDFIPFRTTGDLIRALGGVFVMETGVGGFRRGYSVNGTRDGGLVFLEDGLLLNNPATGLYLSQEYPAEYAASIEHAPPPMGFYYATGGTGGTVNFLSHTRRAPRAVSRVRYTQSTYGFSLLDGSLSQDVARGFNVSLGLQRPVSDGRFDNSALDAWGGRVKFRYDVDGGAVYASDIFNRYELGLSDGVSLATPESLRYENIRALVVNPSAAGKVVRHDLAAGAAFTGPAGGLTTLDIEFTSDHREYRGEAADTGLTVIPFREVRHEQSAGFRVGHSREIAGNRLSVGLEMRSRRTLKDPAIGALRSLQEGITGSLVVNAGPLLSFTPAARFDRYLDRRRLSAGGSARLRLGDLISLTGGVSRSHRFPALAEVNGVAGLALPLDSPDPERHDIVSAGFFAGDSGRTFAAVTLFHRKISGVITLDSARTGVPGDPPLAWRRTADESRSGVSWVSALRVGGILAELTADYLSYGSETARRYAPAWDITAGLYFRDRIIGGHLNLKAGFRGRYFSSYDGEGYSQRHELFVPSGLDIPPAGTLDFVLFAGIGDAVIHLIWENLLDREYVMTVFYPADDRSVRFGLTWDFLD